MTSGNSEAERTAEESRQRFLASLMQSQFLSKPDLELYQRRLMERLVRHAHAQTTRYQDVLRVLFNADGTIDWDRWSDVPILTRDAFQADPEALVARSVPAPAGGATEVRTSGSTGQILPILWDQLAGFAGHMLDARFYQWHGIDTNGRMAFVKSYTDGQYLFPDDGQSKGWHLTGPDADCFEFNSENTYEQQVDWLERRRPDYLSSYPSNILEIAKTIGPERGRQLGIRALFSFGETVGEDVRSIAGDVFGAPVLDRYGSTEVGQIAAQCPVSTCLHVSMENVFPEILDENDRPVRPGEQGRVVVTGLYNYTMPFIRYDQGDYALLAAEPCSCGRSLTSIERIVGRARAVFRFSDGSARFPYLKAREIIPFLPHRQLQIAQTHLDRIEVRYVAVSDDQTVDLEGLTELFRQRMHGSLTVDVKAMQSIPRAPSGKFFDFVSELEA